MSDFILIKETELVNRQDEWQKLVNSFSNQTIFMQPGYVLPWKQLFTHKSQCCFNGITDKQNQLVGLLPFFWEDSKTLRLFGAVDMSDYLDIVVKPSLKRQLHQEIISHLKKEAGPWQTLMLESIPSTSPTLSSFKEMCQAEGWRVEQRQQDVCPVITLPKTWDEYLNSLEPKNQQNFRRLLKNIGSEDEISYRCLEKPDEIEEHIDTFIALHKVSATDKNAFWTPERELFFKQISVNLAEDNWVKLYFLDVNGQPGASLLIFDYHNQFLAYNSGFDAYRYGYLGVGNAIVLHSIQHAIELGRSRYDFMRGDEPYKFLFGVNTEPLYDLIVTR